MLLQTVAFWALATVAVIAAFLVVASRNPVRSVMWLILAFFTTAGLFVLIGAEFLAMLLVVVYVGAVAVLFLFVVMMLDVDFVEMRQGFLQYLPLGGAIAAILAAELALVGTTWVVTRQIEGDLIPNASPDAPSNIEAIGALLYDDYVFVFQAAGIILLAAMVGAIVLTLRQREGVKRQDIAAQVARRRKDAVALTDPKPGEGV